MYTPNHERRTNEPRQTNGPENERVPKRAASSAPPTDARTKPAATNLGEIAGRLERGSGLLVGVDFDGTLAPIAPDPDDPHITPANAVALARLAASVDTVVAVVSGREIADLRPRAEVAGAVYAGNHGLELARGPDSVIHPAARRYRPALDHAVDLVGQTLGDVPGCLIEDKTLSLTVHYRQVPPALQRGVVERIDALAPRLDDGLCLVSGRKSVEIRPDIDWDKGQALQWLRTTLPDGYRAVYLGDDTTDEDVFRTLRAGDVGVHVGRRDTAARYRLRYQRGVAPFLDWLGRRVTTGV